MPGRTTMARMPPPLRFEHQRLVLRPTRHRRRIDRRRLVHRLARRAEHPHARRVDERPRAGAPRTIAQRLDRQPRRSRRRAATIVGAVDVARRSPRAPRSGADVAQIAEQHLHARVRSRGRPRPADAPAPSSHGRPAPAPRTPSTRDSPWRLSEKFALLAPTIPPAPRDHHYRGSAIHCQTESSTAVGPERAMRRTPSSTSSHDLAAVPALSRPRRRVPDANVDVRGGGTPRPHGVRRTPARARPRPATTRSSSGARTAPSGSSRSGAASCAAWSSCRSTTARRPTSCVKVARHRRGAAGARRRRRRAAGRDGSTTVAWLLARSREIGTRRRRARRPTTAAARRDRARRRRRDHLHVRRHRRAEGRHHHAPQHPREHRPDRARDAEVPALRAAVLADSVPEPAAAQPHVRPGDGHVRAADARRRGRLHAELQPARHRPADRGASRLGARVGAEDARRAARARARVAFPDAAEPDPRTACTGAKRWWRYRECTARSAGSSGARSSARRRSIPRSRSSGGASASWSIQGYGLTETAPIVTLNHPFSARKGSVGKPIHGVEVKIAEDGEILVRGDNVTTGYYGAPEATRAGVRGRLAAHRRHRRHRRAAGGVFIRGRKKEMIVTPEGLNVFPEDVERALAGDRRRARRRGGRARRWQRRGARPRRAGRSTPAPTPTPSCATRTRGSAIIRRSAARRSGRATELPRTEGTRKLKRREIQAAGWTPAATPALGRATARATRSVVDDRRSASRAGAPTSDRDTTIDELGLSSLERVELLMALEEQLPDDARRRRRSPRRGPSAISSALVRDVPTSRAAARPDAEVEPRRQPGDRPPVDAAAAGLGKPRERWTGRLSALEPDAGRRGAIRRVSLPTWILPLGRVCSRGSKVEGLEHLRGARGPGRLRGEPPEPPGHAGDPVGAAAALALPAGGRRWPRSSSRRTSSPSGTAAGAWLTNSLNYYLASLFFNAFPLPQREAGTRQTLRYIGELLGDGYSVLIFPEGKRTDGRRDQPVPAGHRHDWRAPATCRSCRSGCVGLDQVLHQTLEDGRRPVRRSVVVRRRRLRLAGRRLRRAAKRRSKTPSARSGRYT